MKATPFFHDRLIRTYIVDMYISGSLAKNKFSTVVVCSHCGALGPCVASISSREVGESGAESSIILLTAARTVSLINIVKAIA